MEKEKWSKEWIDIHRLLGRGEWLVRPVRGLEGILLAKIGKKKFYKETHVHDYCPVHEFLISLCPELILKREQSTTKKTLAMKKRGG
jgi:hypothetical protein